jgi:predicted nucleic acid-binding protein
LNERLPDRYKCLAEIQKGIELLADGKRRVQLEQWLKQDLEAWFSGRVLPVDRKVAGRWASLVVQGLRAGRPLPTVDSLIAATALAYDLTIVTRNVRDFEGAAAVTLNPWQAV